VYTPRTHTANNCAHAQQNLNHVQIAHQNRADCGFAALHLVMKVLRVSSPTFA